MKATRIFPSAPSCASGGIGAESNKRSCVTISLDEERHDLPADKGLARSSILSSGMVQLLIIIFSMLWSGYK